MNAESVVCLLCHRLLEDLARVGRNGKGLAQTANYRCPCGAEVSVICRRPLPPEGGEILVDYRHP